LREAFKRICLIQSAQIQKLEGLMYKAGNTNQCYKFGYCPDDAGGVYCFGGIIGKFENFLPHKNL